jgi:hypothetical protein
VLQYTVRNADGSPQQAAGRRIFTIDGFTIRVSDGAFKGKPALIVNGEETITTPAGTCACYRLKVESDPEALPSFMKHLPSYITGMFMNYTMWVEKKGPHPLILMTTKSDGPDGGDKIQEPVIRTSFFGKRL